MEWLRLLRRAAEVTRDEGLEALQLRARRRWFGGQARVFRDYAAWSRAVPAGPRARLGPGGAPVGVIVPVRDPPPEALFELLRSLREQHYRTWDLVLVDDGSRLPEVQRLLDHAARDERTRLVRHDAPRGVGLATAAGVAASSQDLLAFVDHDDLLAPEALGRVAEAFTSPGVDLVYSDEDKIDPGGRHRAPFFKPAWDPILLLSWNYVGHLTAVRREVLEAVGGVRGGFDGAQDYDLSLRLAERVHRVAHIPQVLYHWREVPGSAAGSPAAKPAAHEAAQRALSEALQRRGLEATVEPGLLTGTFRVHPTPHLDPGQVSAIVCDDAAPAWLEAAGVGEVLVVGREPDPASMRLVTRHALGKAFLFLGEGVTPVGSRRGASPAPALVPRTGASPAQALVPQTGASPARQALESLLAWLQPGLADLVTAGLVVDGRVLEQGLTLGRSLASAPGPLESLAPGEPGYFGLASAPRTVAACSGALALVGADLWRGLDPEAHGETHAWRSQAFAHLAGRARLVALPELFTCRKLPPVASFDRPDPWANPNLRWGEGPLQLTPLPNLHPPRLVGNR